MFKLVQRNLSVFPIITLLTGNNHTTTGNWDPTGNPLQASGSIIDVAKATMRSIIGTIAWATLLASAIPTVAWLLQESQRYWIKAQITKIKHYWWGTSGKARATLALATIIAGNSAAAEATGALGQILELGGLQPGNHYTILTYAFVHADLKHLRINLIPLMLLGPPVERLRGTTFFLISTALLIIVGGIAALYLIPHHWDTVEKAVGLSTMTFALWTAGAYVLAEKLCCRLQSKEREQHLVDALAKLPYLHQVAAVLASAVVCVAFVYDAIDTSTGPSMVGHITALIGGTTIAAIDSLLKTLNRSDNKTGES